MATEGESDRGGRRIDGRAIAARVREEVRAVVEARLAQGHRAPGLATVLVGDDGPSQIYIRNKRRAAEGCGIESRHHALPAGTTTERLLELIEELNADDTVDGILVQSPVPAPADEGAVVLAIDPDKDVDGFHPHNVARLALGQPGFVPCTPLGCLRLLRETGFDPAGKRAVVLGRSGIVGRPMAQLLVHANATVTICHSRTRDLDAILREADLIVSAVGRAGLVTADAVRADAVVLDVGMNRGADGKLCGDADFDELLAKGVAITPVPGGVGPMTIAMLMQNTLTAHARHLGLDETAHPHDDAPPAA